MAQALNTSRVVNVSVSLAPRAAIYRNFGELLILGSSSIINVSARQRTYTDIDGVAADFGVTTPEYFAADLFFSQSPQPAILNIGRWAQFDTPGLLIGGVLPPNRQLLTLFTAVTNGAFSVTFDNGTQTNVSGLNFSGALNLNNVASFVQAALPPGVKCTWDSVQGQFRLTSATSGAASAVGYATAGQAGTDVSGLLGFTQPAGADPVPGVAAESLAAAVALHANAFSQWYGLTVATATPPATSDHLAVAAFIEAAGRSRIYGVTTQDVRVLDGTQSTDVASLLKSQNYKRTFTQYSSSSPYAVASLYGRAFTVDFDGNNTTITLKFKQEPGVAAEVLTESQADALEAKNCNVFVTYDNNTAIVEQGVMANGYFFDEVHGTDWLQNRVQTDVYNVLYQAPKVPQTDPGVHQLVTAITGSCQAGVNNGLVAPGVWNAPGFGSLKQGDTLASGYYVFAPLVATQSQALRETRVAPPIQVAVKLAGAIHMSNISIVANR